GLGAACRIGRWSPNDLGDRRGLDVAGPRHVGTRGRSGLGDVTRLGGGGGLRTGGLLRARGTGGLLRRVVTLGCRRTTAADRFLLLVSRHGGPLLGPDSGRLGLLVL